MPGTSNSNDLRFREAPEPVEVDTQEYLAIASLLRDPWTYKKPWWIRYYSVATGAPWKDGPYATKAEAMMQLKMIENSNKILVLDVVDTC